MAFPSIALYRPHSARNVMKVENGQNGQISSEKQGAWLPGFKKA
jgi:hypothetical protein